MSKVNRKTWKLLTPNRKTWKLLTPKRVRIRPKDSATKFMWKDVKGQPENLEIVNS